MATAPPHDDAGGAWRGERACLAVAIAPLAVLVLTNVLFEVTGFGLHELAASTRRELAGAGDWSPVRLTAETNARLTWSGSALLFYVVLLATVALAIGMLRRTLRGRGYRRLVLLGGVATLTSLAYTALGGATGNALSSIFLFTFDALRESPRFSAAEVTRVGATITGINVLAAIVPILVLLTGCAVLADDEPRSDGLDRVTLQLRRLKAVLHLSSATMASGILHMLVWLRWPATLVRDPALSAELHHFAMAVATYWGVAFTLMIVTWYVPCAWILRQRAEAALARAPGDIDAIDWLSRHGFALSPLRQLPQVGAMFAPLLAGPLGSALAGMSDSIG